MHFVLVHGAGHGAWCWYKLATLLRSDGHKVTAPDMASSGIDLQPLDQVPSLGSYFQPLMEIMASLDRDDRVILVGHSYGGIGIALAMEKYPEKIWVAVFASALMPNLDGPISEAMKESFKRSSDPMDNKVTLGPGPEKIPKTIITGHRFLASKVYQCCQPEDLTLAMTLVRPSSIFFEDLSKENTLTVNNYGSVHRVYVVSKQDKVMEEDFQNWMIKKNPPDEVKSVEGADHMVMLSKTTKFHQSLLEIAKKYCSSSEQVL